MFAGEQEGNGYTVDGDPPGQALIGESSSIRACGGSGEGKEGKGVESDGFPEDVWLGRNEKNALAERIEELERELYDYQFHMGLLLIEKKMRTSEFEELSEGLSEARENLKLERAAFSSTLSEKQKQVQSILIALEAEKQRVADLEETIYKMQAEERYLTDQRETLQSWEPSLQEHELEAKIGGSMPCFQQCSELCNFNSRGRGLYPTADGNERKATDVEIRSPPVISHDILHNKRVEPSNEARKIDKIERFSEAFQSLEQCSEIANDALEIECQPDASFIDEQNESHTLSSKYQDGRVRPNKRTGSLKAVENYDETLDDLPEEIKQHKKCGSEDLNDANEGTKLNLLNTDKMRGSAVQSELLCHVSGTTTFEIDSCGRKTQPACEGHRKRQRTSDVRLNLPGQMRYNFRPSTILKDLISKLQSEHVQLGRDSDETDIDYDPTNSD